MRSGSHWRRRMRYRDRHFAGTGQGRSTWPGTLRRVPDRIAKEALQSLPVHLFAPFALRSKMVLVLSASGERSNSPLQHSPLPILTGSVRCRSQRAQPKFKQCRRSSFGDANVIVEFHSGSCLRRSVRRPSDLVSCAATRLGLQRRADGVRNPVGSRLRHARRVLRSAERHCARTAIACSVLRRFTSVFHVRALAWMRYSGARKSSLRPMKAPKKTPCEPSDSSNSTRLIPAASRGLPSRSGTLESTPPQYCRV